MSGQLTLHGAFSQKRSRVSVDAPSLRDSNPSLFSLLLSVAQPEQPAKEKQQEVLKRRVTTSAHPSRCSHPPARDNAERAYRDAPASIAERSKQQRTRNAFQTTVFRADTPKSDSNGAAHPGNDSPALPLENGPRSFPSARGNGSDARFLPSLMNSLSDRSSPSDRPLLRDRILSRDRRSEEFAQARRHRSVRSSQPSSRVLVLSEKEGALGAGREGMGGDNGAGWQQQGRAKKRQRALSSSDGVSSASVPKRQAHFNHYADGMGWWGDSAVGVDAEEVGMGGTTWEGHGFLFHDPEGF